CYGVVSDRICCDALAAAMGIELERPELPPLPAGATSLYGVVAEQLRRDVRPAVADAFAGHRLDHAALLVLALEREHRLGPAVAEIEVDDLAKLLGRRPADLATGLADLDRAIP